MRVTFCIDTLQLGGTELNALRTAESIDRSRVELTVVHLQPSGPLLQRYQNLGVELVHLPIGSLYSLRTIRQGRRMARMLRDCRTDILHAHDIYTNIFCALWGQHGTGCKLITSRRWWHKNPRRGLAPLNRLAYRLSDCVLANSPAVGQMLVTEERVPQAKVAVIPNFLDNHSFDPPSRADIERHRAAWGIPRGCFVVGIVARLSPVKNHAMLLRAMAVLDDDSRLVMLGDGPLRSELTGLAESLGLTKRVHFAGAQLQASNAHAAFDVSVLCSASEGFPNSLIEAMAAARAVVATRVGGVVDVIKDDVTGLLVPSDDVAAMANRLQMLRDDPARRAALGAAARAEVLRNFQSAPVLSRLVDLYEGLVAGSRRCNARSRLNA